jgi:hypothetical protein
MKGQDVPLSFDDWFTAVLFVGTLVFLGWIIAGIAAHS